MLNMKKTCAHQTRQGIDSLFKAPFLKSTWRLDHMINVRLRDSLKIYISTFTRFVTTKLSRVLSYRRRFRTSPTSFLNILSTNFPNFTHRGTFWAQHPISLLKIIYYHIQRVTRHKTFVLRMLFIELYFFHKKVSHQINYHITSIHQTQTPTWAPEKDQNPSKKC